jgi:hypothetical protein
MGSRLRYQHQRDALEASLRFVSHSVEHLLSPLHIANNQEA